MQRGPIDRPSGEVLFEFVQVGAQMRVGAIDVDTGIEVVAIAPVSASQAQMQSLALGKLLRRLDREKGSEKGAGEADPRGKYA